VGQCSILLERGGGRGVPIPHFIWVGVQLKITTKCVCVCLRGGWSSIFYWRGKAAHVFREGVNLVLIMVIKGTYFGTTQKRYLPSGHFLTIWQQTQSQQV
jgi:hypothetical protein